MKSSKNNEKVLCGDFHMHTVHSDGVNTVSEVLRFAREANLDYISITDHDTLDGSIEASYLDSGNVKVIYGVEMSSYLNDESIHILGYFNNLDDTYELQNFMEGQLQKRIDRALKIRDLLKEHFNIEISKDLLLSVKSITRGHIARCIKLAGYNYTKEDIFKHMLGDGCKAYLPSTKLSTRQAVNILKKAGAVVVIAHPVLIKKNDIEEIISYGVDGLEAIYPLNKESDTVRLVGLAKKHKLLITAGSDFHSYNDYKHGNVGCVRLTGEDLNKFLKKVGI